jgi:hypothetical protein
LKAFRAPAGTHGAEVRAGTERASRAPQDHDGDLRIGVKRQERPGQGLSRGGIHGIARLGAVQYDCPDLAPTFDRYGIWHLEIPHPNLLRPTRILRS